jgi:hypothetical protein
LQRQIDEDRSARSLAASSIGAGGLTVKNGGSITVEPGGNITLQNGNFNAANVTASNNVTAGGTVQGAAVNSTGNMTAAGTVTANADVNAAGYLRGALGPTFNITTGRVTTWTRTSDGLVGTASSSRRFKTNIRPSGIDPLAVIQIEDVLYEYIAEVRKRDDPTYEEYVGPEYHVATEIGAIAEQLHALGLWQFVIYERERVYVPGPPDDRAQSEETDMPGYFEDRLKLDEDGEPVPSGIHYQMLVMSVFPVLRMQQARLDSIETRLTEAGL